MLGIEEIRCLELYPDILVTVVTGIRQHEAGAEDAGGKKADGPMLLDDPSVLLLKCDQRNEHVPRVVGCAKREIAKDEVNGCIRNAFHAL